MNNTLINLFEQTVAQYPDHIFLSENTGSGYVGRTYSQIHTDVLSLATGLARQGVRHGDRVAILCENRAPWILSDLAILYCGAIVVTLSCKLIEREDLLVRLQNSGAETIFVSNSQRSKVEELQAQTNIKRIICFDDLSYSSLFVPADVALLEQVRGRLVGDDPANIIYTSGTTGNPKGVVLTHANNVAHIEKHRPLGDYTSDSSTLALLPLDHCLFHAFFYMAMANGATLAMPQLGKTPLESMMNMMKNIRETHPDILVVVPAMLQTFKLMLIQQCKGQEVDAETARVFFGGRMRYLIAGGALTDPETERFFMRLGLSIQIGYGMTEATAGVSRSYPAQHRTGSVGRPASLKQEVMIVDEDGRPVPPMCSGEILYRGQTVMQGYWRNPEATAEVLTSDGWLHTGDMGHLDYDGFLFIDGRVKSLLISNAGEKYSPEGIEGAMEEESTLIHQMMLYNQQSPCTIALIVPNREQITAALRAKGLTLDSIEGRDQAILLINGVLNRFRRGGDLSSRFPDVWLPATFALLPVPFSVQNGQLTTTQKLVRRKVIAAYRDRIESLFTPEGMNPLNDANRIALLNYTQI